MSRFRWSVIILGVMTLGAFAQVNQPSSQTPKPIIIPEANPLPDANDQMIMHQKSIQRRNFDAVNALRLKQMMQASDELETMAIALKAELDKSDQPSQNEIQKAAAIEKLARAVKERMKLTIGPN